MWEQGVSKELGVYLRQIQHIEERIVSFIAVLEMVRLRWMDIEQKEHLGRCWYDGDQNSLSTYSCLQGA